MPQIINTNVASLNAQRNLNSSQNAMATAMQRLSSGLRINSAKDDAAGLAVTQRMSAQIRSLNQAVRNANDGISMLQTADGAMNEIQNMLQRMKELSTQAANGTISDTDRGFIATEVGQLQQEIDGIANRTSFNGQSLLTGALSSRIDTTGDINAGFAAGAAGVTKVDVSAAQGGKTFTVANYAAGDNVITLSDGTVSQTVDITGGVAAGGSISLNFDKLGVNITLASVAGETADNIGAALKTKTVKTLAGSGAVNLQVGSGTTVNDQIGLSFADTRINSAGALAGLKAALTAFTGATTAANAQTLMGQVNSALDFFSSQRATFGAIQNRLASTVANAQASVENLSAAQSRIQDTDYAAETATMTRTQILQQAGMAMLAQANAAPNAVLSLLKG